MQKVENTYMQDNNRRMPEITDELFFVIDEKLNSVELTDKGHEFLARNVGEDGFFVLPDIGASVAEIEKSDLSAEEKTAKKDELINEYAVKSERVHTINQLLKAYSMFEKDVEYVVIDNKVKIVDEQTGRIMEGRRYSDGLHQAIEAKERVKVEAATQTFATITLQNYFRMYHKLAGMTGTAETEASEFWSIYKLDVVVIPTNRPVIREDRDDKIYKTKREKYNAVVEEIVSLVAEGRPVLVGTASVEVSELLSRVLEAARNQTQRTQRQAPPAGGTGGGRSGSGRAGDDSHQHGGPRYGHQADAGSEGGGRSGHRGYSSVTSRAVWTVSCAAVRAVRATPVRRSSSYRWRMTSCVCSVRSVSPP